jgi:hypothetical protein
MVHAGKKGNGTRDRERMEMGLWGDEREKNLGCSQSRFDIGEMEKFLGSAIGFFWGRHRVILKLVWCDSFLQKFRVNP